MVAYVHKCSSASVGIDLKELGVRCRKVRNFAQGLKFKADFHSKMSVDELGVKTPNSLPGNSNPGSALNVSHTVQKMSAY